MNRDELDAFFAIYCGDIGADPYEIELEPIDEPISVPEPAPREPEKVPA